MVSAYHACTSYQIMTYDAHLAPAYCDVAFGCQGSALKHEWVGMGDDGFPQLEGKVNSVLGEFFEIW